MAELLLRRACERFRCQITEDDRNKIETKTTLVDVRSAVEEIEQHFAARQDLRYFERLSPFLDAVERLSAPVDTLCNGTPFLPWIWAPLKLILQVSRHHSHALEKILSAYGEIGAALPRMTRYSEAFSDNFELQQLLGHLCEDIINFHNRAYQLIRKPGWKIFFSSGWGRFEHHFDALLQGMKRNSDLIDKEATSFEIVQAKEWRTRSDETSMLREKIWQSEQREAVLKWLQDDATNQEMKFEWLRSHYCKGTSQWVTKTTEIEKWLQTSTGSRHLWLYGKPGSGKSILSSQLIHHIREEGKSICFFFFCDYHTASYSVTIQILRSICVQMIKKSPDLVAFVYDEVIQHGRTLSLAVLKPLFKSLVQSFQDVRLIVDGLDEVDSSQHRSILAELDSLVKGQDNCKILVSSQDIPSIHAKLKSKPKLSMAANESGIADDISLIVDAGIANLMDTLDPDIPDSVVQDLRHSLIRNADGIFLWVHVAIPSI